jgi:hypothetical protein
VLKAVNVTALPAAMRYILKTESYARKGQGEKLYCIIAGSAVVWLKLLTTPESLFLGAVW